MISRYKKTNFGIEILEDNKDKFLATLKENEEFIVEYVKGVKLKTYLQVKYLFGGVYKAFIPNVYESIDDAHKSLAELFLTRIDSIEIDDTDKLIEVFSKCRASKPIVSDETVYNWRDGKPIVIRKIKWVQSVSSLTRKELNTYIELIIKQASEIDIVILDAEEWKKL